MLRSLGLAVNRTLRAAICTICQQVFEFNECLPHFKRRHATAGPGVTPLKATELNEDNIMAELNKFVQKDDAPTLSQHLQVAKLNKNNAAAIEGIPFYKGYSCNICSSDNRLNIVVRRARKHIEEHQRNMHKDHSLTVSEMNTDTVTVASTSKKEAMTACTATGIQEVVFQSLSKQPTRKQYLIWQGKRFFFFFFFFFIIIIIILF